jgi:hypothetical protein
MISPTLLSFFGETKDAEVELMVMGYDVNNPAIKSALRRCGGDPVLLGNFISNVKALQKAGDDVYMGSLWGWVKKQVAKLDPTSHTSPVGKAVQAVTKVASFTTPLGLLSKTSIGAKLLPYQNPVQAFAQKVASGATGTQALKEGIIPAATAISAGLSIVGFPALSPIIKTAATKVASLLPSQKTVAIAPPATVAPATAEQGSITISPWRLFLKQYFGL